MTFEEISEELFERIEGDNYELDTIEKLNREEYEAIVNGNRTKAEEINKKIHRRLNILIVPDSK